MGTEALVILIVTAACLVGVGIWFLIRALKTEYPDGTRFLRSWIKDGNSYDVNLILQEGSKAGNILELHTACIEIVEAMVSTHKALKASGLRVSGNVACKKGNFKEISIVLVPDKDMGKYASILKMIDGIPTIFVADLYVEQIKKRGEPIIHELCHVVLHDYVAGSDDHTDPTIWIESGGEQSLQHCVREQVKIRF